MWNTAHKVHKGSFLFPSQINKQLHFVPLRKTKLDYFSQTARADALPVASLLQSEAPQKRKKKKKEKQKEPASLPTEMHIGNPLTQRHHLPVCTEQQQPLWILNLNGLIEPPTPICSKAASEPLSSKLWSPCRSFFFPSPSRICLPLKSHCEAAREYKF